MKKLILSLMLLSLMLPVCRVESGALGYRFVEAEEAARLLLSNRDYYENLTQRMWSITMPMPPLTSTEG